MFECVSACLIGLHLLTYHPEPRQEPPPAKLADWSVGPAERPEGLKLRTATPGVYVRFDSGLTLGLLSNSLGRTSAYAAWNWELWGPFSLTLGGVTGYREANVVPLLGLSARIPLSGSWAARFTLTPASDRFRARGALNLAIEKRF